MNWEDVAHDIAKETLPEYLRLHDFKIIYSQKGVHLQISLDKIESPLGSPTLAECASYSRTYSFRLGEFIEAESSNNSVPKNYTIEISSPGAQRRLESPDDFARFCKQPMKVQYYGDNHTSIYSEVLIFLGLKNGDRTLWQLANIKFNKKQGKIKKPKKQPEFEILLNKIKQVNLFVDV